MPRGQVKWFDPKKGYGFIIGPEGQDVFVHYSHILADGFKSLKDGQWVEYELVQGEKGWQARNVAGSEAEAAGKADGGDGPVSTGYEPPPSMDQPSQSSSGAAAPPRSGGYEGGYEGGGSYDSGAGYKRGGYEGADD